MFRSVLVANRGEIACRVFRTCARLGVRTIAVYSAADRDALHVRKADSAICIGPPSARESYLRADAIVEAAIRSGAEAIHPGYGFLSERPELIEACEANGIAFIGPALLAIRRMGDKITAKQIARKAGVPGIPGYDGEDQSPARLISEVARIGLPVMVKAAAGGGGKGIRRVTDSGSLATAIDLAKREARAAFGDDRVLIERCIDRPRHVEVQVVGDRHGNVIHLLERDCSTQRSHQKLIEECPAPGLPASLREELHDSALRIARGIEYHSVGTVEFLVDARAGLAYFMEMNTRLQVEHTITEAVTGLDLVELQIRIAAGEELPIRQSDVLGRGHAIEARLTAERADASFKPQTGRIVCWRPPEGVRVDSGIDTGSEVTPFYDSLLAKIIAHGDTREDARRVLAAALAGTTLLGVGSTGRFLRDVLNAPAFARADVSTDLLEEAFPSGWRAGSEDDRLARATAAAIWLAEQAETLPVSPWRALRGFRVGAGAGLPARVHCSVSGETEASLVVDVQTGAYVVHDAEGSIAVRVQKEDAYRWSVIHDLEHDVALAHLDSGSLWLRIREFEGCLTVRSEIEASSTDHRIDAASSLHVLAPMPGLLAAVHVGVGDLIAAGARVVTLESMKLLMDLKSSSAGRVAKLHCVAGTTVGAGSILVSLDALDSTDQVQTPS